jgi:thymidylate synthase ThyX
MTGFVSDWKHFFKLRCHSTAHPDARALAIPLQDKFIELNYITDENKNN